MAAFQFTLESRKGVKDVKVQRTDGLGHACMILREKYSFEEYRIINVAALPDE